MSDEPKGPEDASPEEQLEELESLNSDELSAKERFQKTSHIALLMAYDLIDKLRYWEKQTLELPEEQIQERQQHLIASLDQLRTAYLAFTDLDD